MTYTAYIINASRLAVARARVDKHAWRTVTRF